MDVAQTAKYMDRTWFDLYIPDTDPAKPGAWQERAFKGQLKRADTFVSIWNRPTRKRMLYTSPEAVYGLPVNFSLIRANGTSQPLMVETPQVDSYSNEAYRVVRGLHMSRGPVTIYKRATKGSPTESVQALTVGDYELRSAKSGLESDYVPDADFFVFLPPFTPVDENQIIQFDDEGIRFLVMTSYSDSGLMTLRCRKLQSADTDGSVEQFVYLQKGTQVYDPNTQTTTTTGDLTFNITGRVTVKSTQEDRDGNTTQTLNIVFDVTEVDSTFEPKIDDTITVFGKTHYVTNIARNATQTEWQIEAQG